MKISQMRRKPGRKTNANLIQTTCFRTIFGILDLEVKGSLMKLSASDDAVIDY